MTAAPAVPAPGAAAEDAAGWVTARIGATGFRATVSARTHSIVVDEPLSFGGTDVGPTPYEYLLTALASCMVMTLRVYADRKRWPLDGASVQLRSGNSHERDCEKCDVEDVGIGRIERRIELNGFLSEEQKKRLLQIADRCPVKQTLERGMKVVTVES